APVERRPLAHPGGLRVGDGLASGLGRERRKTSELAAAALDDGWPDVRAEVAEEQEWFGRRPLLAHEQERQRRREPQDRRGGAHSFCGGERRDALPEGAVADLIVVLQEADKRRGR